MLCLLTNELKFDTNHWISDLALPFTKSNEDNYHGFVHQDFMLLCFLKKNTNTLIGKTSRDIMIFRQGCLGIKIYHAM